LRSRAHAIVDALGWERSRLRETVATIGGGSLPGDTLESVGIAVPVEKPNAAACRLRVGETPVVGRVHDGELVLDLRTVAAQDDDALVAALRGAFG
jgi:L-seryl-tRNA(Ser) seleniumtransferase